MQNKAFSKIWIIIILIILIIGVVYFFLYGVKTLKTPLWVKLLIATEKIGVTNPPSFLTQCEYENKIVYYLPPHCCDIASKLYDKNGSIICSPDGGFTGGGDGKCQNFLKEKKNCKIIWEASGSNPY